MGTRFYYSEPIADKKGMNAILKKIEKLLPKDIFEGINKNSLRRKYDTFNNAIDGKVYKIIEIAFDKRKTVEIAYFNMESAKIKKREIDIYHKTSKYVIAYCHLRQAMRKFRTSRIVSAKLGDKTYIIPDNFDKNEY